MPSQASLAAANGGGTHGIEPALESLLNRSMLRVDVVAEQTLCGHWFMDEPHYHCGLFHLTGQGRCRVESGRLDRALALEAGDLVVFPHGDPHCLRAAAATGENAMDTTSLICGELHFAGRGGNPLGRALPPCFVVRAQEAGDIFRQLSAMMVEVSASRGAGRQVLLNKLADALFTLAVCDYASRHAEQRGLFAALADSRLGRVLQAVHEEPGRDWTMQSMAALACLSRSSFAERFTQRLGMPPLQYVTQWRVSLAERMLQERELSVAHIAERLGYRSEAAFRRLFKRVSGTSPGRLRATAAAAG
ncbi:AraC family transcriptional regulator [Frateuria defendens]|uniref:AraC family transcriptional regulator n=1 Tax=Frateuria defendens TaxID=2219559 RepID=UPI00066FFA7E|nr:AraC family transcriptional regulator [Frateuria defendens]